MFVAVVKSRRVNPPLPAGKPHVRAEAEITSAQIRNSFHCKAQEGGHNSQHLPSNKGNPHVRAQEDGHTHQGGQAQRCII